MTGTLRRPPVSHERRLGLVRRDACTLQPLLHLDGIKPEQVAPLEVWDAPLEHEPPDVTLVDVQLLGDLLESEQPPWMGGAGRVSLVPDQTDFLGHQGATAIRLAPVRPCGRRSVHSLQLGTPRPKRDREICSSFRGARPGRVVPTRELTRDHLSALDRHNPDLKRRQGLLSTFTGTIPHRVRVRPSWRLRTRRSLYSLNPRYTALLWNRR